MDKEAQGEIGVAFCEENDWDYYNPWGRKLGDNFATKILDMLHKLGYRKLPDKPPPLIDIKDITDKVASGHWLSLGEKIGLGIIAEAQRQADIKHYTE